MGETSFGEIAFRDVYEFGCRTRDYDFSSVKSSVAMAEMRQ